MDFNNCIKVVVCHNKEQGGAGTGSQWYSTGQRDALTSDAQNPWKARDSTWICNPSASTAGLG